MSFGVPQVHETRMSALNSMSSPPTHPHTPHTHTHTHTHQMFEHSQALLAHRQQQQRAQPSTTTPSSETPVQPVEASSFQSSTAQQHGSITVESQQSQSVNTSSGGGGGVITHDLLTTALAGAMGSTENSAQPSPLSSLDFSTVVASRLDVFTKHRKFHVKGIVFVSLTTVDF